MDVVFRFLLFSALTALLFSYDILYPGQGGLAPTAIVHNIQEPFDLAPVVEYLEDPERGVNNADASAGVYQGQWKKNTKRLFIAKNIRLRYWFRLKLRISERLHHQ